jgi:hypothetical protein
MSGASRDNSRNPTLQNSPRASRCQCTQAGSRHMSDPGRPRQMHPMQEHRRPQPQTPLARTGLDRLELSGLVRLVEPHDRRGCQPSVRRLHQDMQVAAIRRRLPDTLVALFVYGEGAQASRWAWIWPITRYIRLRCVARTWERACNRVRLGHVIGYIGSGRMAAKVRTPRQPYAIHGPRGRSIVTQLPASTGKPG